jgi:hypothetical protein
MMMSCLLIPRALISHKFNKSCTFFWKVSGLKIILEKCVAYCVACEGLNINQVLQDFGGSRGSFPCNLGLPLGFHKSQKVEVQPLFDCTMWRSKGCKGKDALSESQDDPN